MDDNMPVIAKRILRIVHIAYFMLRRGISKSKIMADLNKMMMKRGKIAGKAIGNLMFHQQHRDDGSSSFVHALNPSDYEFSCSNSPSNPTFRFAGFNVGKRSQGHFFPCAQPPATHDEEIFTANAVKAVLEMMTNEVGVEASPALPGFGRSPIVRQLRITDSPFPVSNTEDDTHVDKDAEEFISKFYKQLKRQKMAE